jgi:hypothetical protein
MGSVYLTLNDVAVPLVERLELARRVLRECKNEGEDTSAAWTWLAYRMLDGTIPGPDIAEHLRVEAGVCCLVSGLGERWYVSQGIAKVYLAHRAALDWVAFAEHIVESAEFYVMDWPPCVLNLLRAFALLSAADRHRADKLTMRAQQLWKLSVEWWDTEKHPLRCVEFRDDIRVLQDIAAIQKAAGLCQYPPHAWLPLRQATGHPYYDMMTALGAPQLR